MNLKTATTLRAVTRVLDTRYLGFEVAQLAVEYHSDRRALKALGLGECKTRGKNLRLGLLGWR
uniref:Uncharacterized protein n=1 Tax=Utricularia reniformis TaxID=192314 RepID=A0A1Y0B3W1_9LAMI|nr:hypothetical protein AEK19_MT1936 [Utricularia reniformis]ART32101.1 hypothetical protein AEK19_MT1936 [Utricularia reniformis]